MLWSSVLHLLLLGPAVAAATPQAAGRIVSEHVWVKVPLEREWLGRDAIVELERAWRYIHGVTGEKLPRRLTVEIAWDAPDSGARPDEERVVIGLGSAAARAAPRAFLLHAAAREMAMYGLLELSRGAVSRDDLHALGEGMAEIFADQYGTSARALTASWYLAHLVDRIRPLGLAALADWPGLSAGGRDLRARAPAITFLLTCLEMGGRDRTLKLFEALRKGTLQEALASALKQRADFIEDAWLRKIRAQKTDEDVTVTSDEDLPVFKQAIHAPRVARAGSPLELRLQIEDARSNLSPRAIFVIDEASGRVLEGSVSSSAGAKSIRFEIPVDATRRPGVYPLRGVAIDDAGNVRCWTGSYTVE
jgi:hypothetical protein